MSSAILYSMQRRTFIKAAAAAALGGGMPALESAPGPGNAPRRITIAEGRCNLELMRRKGAFGFKGHSNANPLGSWHVASMLRSTSGKHGIGLANEGCMWSDAAVTLANGGNSVNAMMYVITRRALKLAEGKSFTTPPELLDQIYPEVYDFAKYVTGAPGLRATFALNALVSVDFAAWVLYARENGITTFDAMVPPEYKAALAARHPKAAAIPLAQYSMPVEDVVRLVDDGYFFMKIKIGQGGTQEEMLAKDCARASALHAALKDRRTPYTASGRIPYYFDANGRYEKKETLLRFLDHLKRIGALDQVAIIEEPFDEMNRVDVSDIPVRLASDEAAHTPEDAKERIEMGYAAMALKPIAKTLSVSMRVAEVARRRNVPCFCADLTVSPVNVEWNKAVAARLAAFPGMGDMGLVESNGHQNYSDWEIMRRDLPYPDAPWTRVHRGVFELDEDYWSKSGGVLAPLPRHEALFGLAASHPPKPPR